MKIEGENDIIPPLKFNSDCPTPPPLPLLPTPMLVLVGWKGKGVVKEGAVDLSCLLNCSRASLELGFSSQSPTGIWRFCPGPVPAGMACLAGILAGIFVV